MRYPVRYGLLAVLLLTAGATVWFVLSPAAPALPNYAVIYRDTVPETGRTEGHVVVRSLARHHEDRRHACEAIAAAERLDVALFFSTDAAYAAYRGRPVLQRTLRAMWDGLAALRAGFVCAVSDGVLVPDGEGLDAALFSEPTGAPLSLLQRQR
jgi:hypothetical protein